MYHNDFYESYIPHYPRRSCEALYVPTFLGKLAEHYPLPTHLGFDDLYSWLKPLIEAEDKLNKKDV
jgi:hypothetical protein